MTAIHKTAVLVYDDRKSGVYLVDAFAMSGDLSNRRCAPPSKPAVLVQFLETFHLDVKFR